MQKKLSMKAVYFLIFNIQILLLSTIAYGMERFDIITTRQLSALMDQRELGEKQFHLVNTLDELISNHHSIPGSINIPWSRVDELAEKKLGADKDKLIVTYCMGYR